MLNKISKTKAKEEIEEFFKNIKNKSPKEVKKIKKLAMSFNILLKEKRKTFCKKCLNPYSGNEKIRINKNFKLIYCNHCKSISRFKLI